MSNIETLKQAVQIEGSIAGVAARVDVSRAALSLILRGKYDANPEKILRKVEDAYSGVRGEMVSCPALRDEISVHVCRRYTNALRDGKRLGDATFAMVRDTCPYCPNF